MVGSLAKRILWQFLWQVQLLPDSRPQAVRMQKEATRTRTEKRESDQPRTGGQPG
jgi:hypothetical protein